MITFVLLQLLGVNINTRKKVLNNDIMNDSQCYLICSGAIWVRGKQTIA